MGLQLGIPILLCLIFKVNVLIFFICALMWVLHEFVVPLYLFMLIVVINWDVAVHGRLEKLRNADGRAGNESTGAQSRISAVIAS
jgi:hypothetical protein